MLAINSSFTGSFFAGRRPAPGVSLPFVTDNLVNYLNAGDVVSYIGSGSAIYDLTANNKQGVLINSPVYSTNYAGILNYDGVTQFMVTGNLVDYFSPGNGTVSVEIWVRPFDDGVILNEQGSQSAPVWYDSQMEIVGGELKIGAWNGTSYNSFSAGPVTMGVWQSYAMTYDGNTLAGYINGRFKNSIEVFKINPWDVGLDYYYAIMGSTSLSTNLGDGTRLNGDFGRVRIYNSALTPAQIAQNYLSTRNEYSI